MYNKQDPKTIEAMFNSIAKNYDRTNAILSFQLHKLWNRELVRQLLQKSNAASYLDLCCGTGEIAFTFLKQASCNAYLLDFSEEMLGVAKRKADQIFKNNPPPLTYLKADAQEIPLLNNSVSCASIAYGIRNVKEPAKCLAEVFRVLQPGGSFGILELTRPTNPIIRLGHTAYLKTIVPLLGWCLSSNQNAYQYLCNSIQAFIQPKELELLLRQQGFQEISLLPLSGGISTLILARKPKE